MKSQGFFVATRDMVLVVNTLSELLLHGKVKLILGSKRSGLGGSVCGKRALRQNQFLVRRAVSASTFRPSHGGAS